MNTKYIILLLTLTATLVAGHTAKAGGTLTGRVTDEKQQPVIGAIAILDSNTTLAAQTDYDGNYKIENIPAGIHSLVIKYIAYTTVRVEIAIAEGEKTYNTSLQPESKNMKEVTIKDTRKKATESAVVMEIKKANSIVSGVSSAQIQKSQDRSAADVVKRIPGVTITDGRFINVRGLSERYNNVFLNDAGAPSSEADRRAFSFDAIPSGMIERILIYKTPSAELPGDFAGGMVKIYTQAMPDKNSVSLSYTTSFRQNSTFKPFYQTQGSPTDALGFDNGFRNIPAGTPAFINKNDSNINTITKAFKNTWGIKQTEAIPDQRANLTFQRVVKKGNFQFGNTTALSYSNTQTTYLTHRNDYDSINKNLDQYEVASTRTVNIGAMENMAFRFGDQQIELKALLNQTGKSQTTKRSDTFNGRDQLLYLEYYQQRTTALVQLAGNHKTTNESTLYNWNVSYAYNSKSEPDFKRINYYRNVDTLYRAQIANTPDIVLGGGRFFSSLKEHVFSFNHGLKQQVKIKDYIFEIGAGNYIEYKQRDFAARSIGYTVRQGPLKQTLIKQPLSTIFDTANVGSFYSFLLDENTSPSDAYTASNLQIATYLNFVFPIGSRVKLIAGLRHEYNKQSLNTFVSTDTINRSNITHFWLPSVNASFSINEKMLVRAAYGETVNRPEFREWAPFSFYDFDVNALNYGSLYPTVFYPNGTTLNVATIHNADLRYEWYPSAGDLIHAGGFFKYFNDPIQQVITPTGGSDSKGYTYINGDHAFTAGAEIDLRKNLGFLMKRSSRNVMQDFTLVFNAAYIYSKLYMPALTSLNPTSQLQGQSPYIVNAGLYYQSDRLGLQASLLYNVFGPRIFAIGNEFYPSIGEMPRHTLDFSVSYTVLKHLTFLFAVQDIIGQPSRLMLDIDRNGKFEDGGMDREIRHYTTGPYYSVGVKAKF